MILQALYEYYRRRDNLPRPGFEHKELKFLIVLEEDGTFFGLFDLRDETKKFGRFYRLPQGIGRTGRSSWQTAYLLWDHYGYVLGQPKAAKTAEEAAKNLEMARLQHGRFVEQLQNLPEEVRQDAGVHAVLEFYRRGELEKVKQDPLWTDCCAISGCNLSFQLRNGELVAERPAVQDYVTATAVGRSEEKAGGSVSGRCLVTGTYGPLARLFKATPVPGGKSNAALVSFQKNSGYDSYGKEQCFNAPIGQMAEFACSTALNTLLAKGSENKFSLGGVTTVFWAAEENPAAEELDELIRLMVQNSKDNPDRQTELVQSFMKSVHTGRRPEGQETQFYFLSLSPNIARIAVRCWKVGTVQEFARNLCRHFEDLAIVRSPRDYPYPSLTSLLAATALDCKMENVAEPLTAATLSAVLEGKPYPDALFQQCLRRIRATREITASRAAILKAYLNRKLSEDHGKEIKMGLDRENGNSGYLCGRLFAVLEKCQGEAQPGINATVRDRYYGAASTTPSVVFGRLLALNGHHLDKLSIGRQINFKGLLEEIIDKINDFPAHLTLRDQGRFSIGYYHQMKDLFTANADKTQQ